MSRSLKVAIKYFTVCGFLWIFALTIRPILHYVENRTGELPFWIWEAEYPLSSLIIIGIVIFWGYQTYQRVLQKAQRKMFCAICYFSASWMGMDCARHIFFSGEAWAVQSICRFIWYCNLISWMAVPLLMYLIALYIGKSDREKIDRRYLLLWIPYVLINLGIMTNDLHEQAVIYPSGIANWRTDFIFGWLFYVAYGWIIVMSVSAVIVLFRHTKVASLKKYCILPLLTLAMGQLLTLLAYLDIFYLRITEVCILAFGVTLEICIRTNLIPNNVHYTDLIRNPEFQVYIYNDEYDLASKPEGADDLPIRQTPYMLDETHRVDSAKVYGGYVFWIEDESEVHRLRTEMEEIQELLKEESSLIKEENDLKKRKISVSIKRQLYDSISEFSTPMIQQMEKELDALSLEEKPKELAHLCIQMAYLKRRSNMVLKQQENGMLPLEELYNAVYEPFSYMEYLGIYACASGRLRGDMDGDLIIAGYDMFYECLKTVYQELSAILVNFSEDKQAEEISIHVMMSLREGTSAEEGREILGSLNHISCEIPEIRVSPSYDEDEATIYIQISIKKGDFV